jgi:hypothetical protein
MTFPLFSHAAPVAWGSWTGVTDNTAIQTPANYITFGGVNFNGSTTTISNGTRDVVFTGVAWHGSGTAAGVTVANTGFGFQSTGNNSNVTAAVGSPQTWNTVLDRVIGDFDNSAAINLSGLTVGRSYSVQFFSSAPDANILANSKISSGGVDSPVFGSHVPGGTKYIIATFTADSTNQSFAISGTEPTYSALVIGVQPAGGDTTPPAISSLNPADNAVDVPATANLTATFSETIATGSGNVTVRNLMDSTETTIAITDASQVSISGAVLTINPAADLAPGKSYSVRMDAGVVRDLASPPNAFAGITDDTRWNFSTLAPDTTPPVWTATWPKAGQLTATSITLRAQTNEPGTGYYAVLPAGSAAPGAAQVKAGTDSADAPALAAGSLALTANSEATATAAGLTADTAYDVYFVAEDAVPNLQSAPVLVGVSLVTPAVVAWGDWAAVTDSTAIQTLDDYNAFGGVNFNGSNTTINNGTRDVVFTGIAHNASGMAAGVTVTNTGFRFQSTGGGNSNVSSADGTPQNWATVLDRVIGDDNNDATIHLSGLTAGTSYSVQFFSSAPDANILSNSQISSGGVDSPFFGSHVSGGTKSIIATFTANSPNQPFTFSGSEPTYGALVIGVQHPANSYAAWISGFHVGSQTAFADDPDGDGLENGVENFLGTSPAAGNAGLVPLSRSGNTFTLTHPQSDRVASDIAAVNYKWSTDLQGFHASGASASGIMVDLVPALHTPEAGTTTVVATVTGAMPSRLYVRLEVTRR